MDHLVASTDWPALVGATADAGTIIELTWGSDDRVGDRPYARTMTGSSIEIVPGAAHHLPMTHGARCRTQLRALAR